MNRRKFLATPLALAGLSLSPRAFAQTPLTGADMHSHWGTHSWGGDGSLNIADGLRKEMLEAGILLVAMKVIADYPQLTRRGGGIYGHEYAAPGVLRTYFERMAALIKQRAQHDGLVVVGSRDDLAAVLSERKPGIALAVEGGDFLEGRLEPLEKARNLGLCHLQLVHYRMMEVGDLSTEAPRHNGLTAFGKELVRACNRMGILVDVAHCNSAGIQHALETSSKPVVYSHGWVAQKEAPAHSNRSARAIHLPLARELAAKGGVVGAFPLGWRTPEAYAEYLQRLAGLLGAQHVGIGTDHSGLPSSALSGYRDFPRIAAALAKGGMRDTEVAAVMGGNYLRVLQQAMSV